MEKTIAIIHRHPREIRVILTKGHEIGSDSGTNFIHIREYAGSKDIPHLKVPTERGAALPEDAVGELITALQKAKTAQNE